MSGAFSGVPNQFANAVTATGLQLDQDFNTFTAYINDPTNRNNSAAAGGATNTLNITFAPPVVGGYTAGLALAWKWNVTNTGAVVVNANALGNISLVNADSSALVAGQGPIGSIGTGVYDGTQAIYLTPPSPASAAAVSAAVTLAPYVSPGRMQNHPGVAKAWASFIGTNTGTITALGSYNVATIVRVGTGTYSVALTTAMSSTAYAVIANANAASFAGLKTGSLLATGFILLTFSAGGSAVDASEFGFLVYGSQ